MRYGDQVIPTNGLASGLPLALLAVSAPRPANEKPAPAKKADTQSQGQGGRLETGIAKIPEAAMGQLNNHLQQTGSELQFQVDKSTGRTIFKVVDPNNGAVLLQVPSEEILAMARNLRDLEKQRDAPGVLMDKEG